MKTTEAEKNELKQLTDQSTPDLITDRIIVLTNV